MPTLFFGSLRFLLDSNTLRDSHTRTPPSASPSTPRRHRHHRAAGLAADRLVCFVELPTPASNFGGEKLVEPALVPDYLSLS